MNAFIIEQTNKQTKKEKEKTNQRFAWKQLEIYIFNKTSLLASEIDNLLGTLKGFQVFIFPRQG